MPASEDLFDIRSVHPWYGLRTRSNHEKLALTMLSGKGYKPYLPVYRSRRRWSDRVVDSEVPLFPGYVFCRFDLSQRFLIAETPGIVSVVGMGKHPTPIPDQEINAIETVLASGLFDGPCPYLREGQAVRVARGPLQGLEGILLRKKSEWRLVVSISMLQRSISVEVDREWIATN